MAEISFEDATSEVEPPTGAVKPPKIGDSISFEDMQASEGAGQPSLTGGGLVAKAASAWMETQKSTGRAGLALTKGLAAGALDLGGMAAEGIAGLASAATGNGFEEGAEAARTFTTNARDYVAAVTKVNLSQDDSKEAETVTNLLSLIPRAITAAGDTVYEKTGSAIAGAGTQAMLTLITLKPGTSLKVMGGVKRLAMGEKMTPAAKASAEKVQATFDELAIKEPTKAQAIADHLKEVDPELSKQLSDKVQELKNPSAEAQVKIAEEQAQAKIKEMVEAQPPKPRMKQVGTTPEGKPRVRVLTPEQASTAVADTMADGYKTLKKKAESPTGEDPVMFTDSDVQITQAGVVSAFEIGEGLKKVPGVPMIEAKLREYHEQVLRNISPESLGVEAKSAAAVVAKNLAEQMQKDSSYFHRSAERRTFWNHRGDEAIEFIRGFEKGEIPKDPIFQKVSEGYRNWNEEIYKQDKELGFDYEAEGNYLYHVFDKSADVAAFFSQTYGPKWNNPRFIKDRAFDMYSQAVKAGFKPKFKNPEDIMLARQHASDVAQMQVQSLRDMETYGLARKVKGPGEARPTDFPSTKWRSPNGDNYWVHNKAAAVMHNAFNTKSLWSMEGMGGDAFRGMMWLKNTIVPIKLAISLFHPLHVLTIDNATSMVRTTKELMSGATDPLTWFKEMTQASFYKGFVDSPTQGSRVIKAYQGKIADGELTAVDKQSLLYMNEGGMIPEMAAQYKTNAVANFREALEQRSLKAAWHAPFAAINMLQKPLFEKWIPALKVSSYLRDVGTAIKADPTLLQNPLKRQTAFRALAKSVDNRYGEMAYNTLFWNRWIKDLGVASTLSLGWNLGFIREYGGGALDLGKALTTEGGLKAKASSGLLDRPLFVTFYTAQALAYGGLMTWAFTGKSPETLMDYVFPKNGEQNKDGTDQRVSTMFYPREFMAIAKHVENEGAVTGLKHLVTNKAAPTIGLVQEWATGVNDFGQEIADPDAPLYLNLAQKLAYTFTELEPISIAAIRQSASDKPVKTAIMSVAGFTPAPKYISETATEGRISQLYKKYYAPKQTPFERARFSADAREMKLAYDKGDMDHYQAIMDKMEEKYSLTAKEMRKLEKKVNDESDPMLTMFGRLSWQQQKKVLDEMTEEEREKFLPLANKEHLRFNYEPPEEKSDGSG